MAGGPIPGPAADDGDVTRGRAAVRASRGGAVSVAWWCMLALLPALLLAGCTAGSRARGMEPREVAEARLESPEGRGPSAEGAHDAASRPLGREVIESLEFSPLRFDPPQVDTFELSNGIPVFYLYEPSLPVVEVMADFRGGYVDFDRSHYAAATLIGPLMLSGGTEALAPDSVDKVVEYYALSPSFGTAGAVSFSSIGSLRRHFDVALSLWTDMLRRPRLDPERVEVRRLQELESVRRMRDLPNTVAIRAFNQLMYGDHSTGWTLEESDLTPEHVSAERLRRVHREIFCRDNMLLGVAGDITRDELVPKLEAAFGDWPPCPRDLGKPTAPPVRKEGGVLVVHKELEQSTIVMGQAGGIARSDGEPYFTSQIANWILGGGGFSSRLLSRLRTEEGLAYQAYSVWTTGSRTERVFGAFTQTKAETTIAAAERIRETIAAMREAPPAEEEVRLAVDNIANGFVFAFENAGQIVRRQMTYRLGGLPSDWLQRYLDGIQAVTPDAVHEVVRNHLDPDNFSIVIIGDTTRFDAAPSTLGPRIER